MAKELLPDAFWARIAPLLPPEPPKPNGGRLRVSDRAALTEILFVLKTGIPWEYLPAEMGCGSGMTCWRRLHQMLLEELAQADRIDWDRAALDVGVRSGGSASFMTRYLSLVTYSGVDRAAAVSE